MNFRSAATALAATLVVGLASAQTPLPTPAAPAPAAAAAPAVDETTAKLQQLAALHAQGVLSDEEFA
jgi:hypothetical protein